jgi:glycerol-3-phosphate dehydrogenase
MNRYLLDFSQKTYEVLIIGGGITGACQAWGAVNWELTVGLIEKTDFSSVSSSASSKLLHGGIRYLQRGCINTVREFVLERAYYQKIASYLSKSILLYPVTVAFRRVSP